MCINWLGYVLYSYKIIKMTYLSNKQRIIYTQSFPYITISVVFSEFLILCSAH